RGYARALLNAFVTEARNRGVRRIWVASYDFQAPGMYEKAGFKRMAEFEGWPEGHSNVLLDVTAMAGLPFAPAAVFFSDNPSRTRPARPRALSTARDWPGSTSVQSRVHA